jgi:hypothetical protein
MWMRGAKSQAIIHSAACGPAPLPRRERRFHFLLDPPAVAGRRELKSDLFGEFAYLTPIPEAESG